MLWIIVSILVVVLDQTVKYIVVNNISTGEMIPVIDKFFYLTLHKNPGAAWGILQDSRLLFLIMIPVISAVVVYYMAKNKVNFLRFSLALILGGAIGNYIDRLFEGKVTDFLLFYIGSYPFPIFNVADMSVTCGTILLAIYLLFIYKEPAKIVKAEGTGEAAETNAVDEAIAQEGENTLDELNKPHEADAQGKTKDAE